MIKSDMPVSVSLYASPLNLDHSHGTTDLAPALPKPADIQPPPSLAVCLLGGFPSSFSP
jgi:hypothetical protein